MPYSQHDEEVHIIRELTLRYGGGKFLDIGAYDGKTFSNTHALALLGWEGVCVEADPGAFSGLVRTYQGNDKIKLVNCIAGFSSMFRKFYADNGGAVGTTEESNYNTWKDKQPFKEIWMQELPVGKILEMFPPPYKFISIDTEGTSFDILRELKIENIAECFMVCVEYDKKKDAVLSYLADRGYKCIYENAENIVAMKA